MPSQFRQELAKLSATIFGNVAAGSLLAGFVIPMLSIVEKPATPFPTSNQIAVFVFGSLMFMAFSYCAFKALRSLDD